MGRVIIQPEKLAAANRYANLMRNSAKRRYAFAYLSYLKNGGEGQKPEWGNLSYMAAQSVRLHFEYMNLWEGALI